MVRRTPKTEDEAYDDQRQKQVDALQEELAKAKAAAKDCLHCGSPAEVLRKAGSMYPWKIGCSGVLCGISTPEVREVGVALTIWNRRAARPPVRAGSKRRPSTTSLD